MSSWKFPILWILSDLTGSFLLRSSLERTVDPLVSRVNVRTDGHFADQHTLLSAAAGWTRRLF